MDTIKRETPKNFGAQKNEESKNKRPKERGSRKILPYK
jgi:hypothetical protein